MPVNNNKSLILIIVSSVTFLPNLGGLLVAVFGLMDPPIVLYIVPGLMVILSTIGFIYGIMIRQKSN